jgi:DNA repair exonuclease SbcCD nuclease subunit
MPIHPGQPVLPTEDPLVSRTLFLPFDAFFVGHYHEPQVISENGVYGGAPFINEYGESTARGFTVWTQSEGFRTVEVPQPRKVAMELDSYDINIEWGATGLVPGDRVKVVLKVDGPGAINSARMKAVSLARTAAAAGLEAKFVFDVAKVDRMRDGAAEVTSVTTMKGKFSKWIGVLSETPKAEDLARALELLDEIEAVLDGAK